MSVAARVVFAAMSFAIVAAPVAAQRLGARELSPRIPLIAGLTVRMTLHIPGGASGCTSRFCDREDLVTLDDVSASGVKYLWRFIASSANGDTIRDDFRTFVKRADLSGAVRWREFLGGFGVKSADHPGYTVYTLSASVHEQLRTTGSTPFAIMGADFSNPGGPLARFGGARVTPVLWRGTLTRVSAGPEPFPLLVDGRRISVPALHLRGQFTATRQRRWEPEFWVLADSAHALFLKVVAGADHVLQTVSIDTPFDREKSLERTLLAACRVEVPGIYFGFNSAALYPTSDQPIATLARLLSRHPDWIATIEGHTDNIGSDESNKSLSRQRADAVRNRIAARHQIDARRLRAAGYGESVPRESNETVEGRARNRRVELVRECTNQVR